MYSTGPANPVYIYFKMFCEIQQTFDTFGSNTSFFEIPLKFLFRRDAK